MTGAIALDDDDFEPTKYPEREAVTMVLALMVVLGLIGWGLWALAWWALGVF